MSATPDNMIPPEITLIVAATTRHMGIGKSGGLPWKGLKQEMAYFARVTKRVPTVESKKPLRNAVIMGRKTWESIPEKFKPLKGRANLVLSRAFTRPLSLASIDTEKEAIKVASAGEALSCLEPSTEFDPHELPVDIHRVFVIGGSDVYRTFLSNANTKRILLTRVLSDFDCDTYFPVVLGNVGEWRKRSKEELDAWVGETVPEGEQEENGTRYVFEMYERD